jgi:RAB protein geranylgeranyltransferase component A
VGGGIYVLGTRIESLEQVTEDSEQLGKVKLSNGETVRTRHLINAVRRQELPNAKAVSKIIGVVSSPLASLFKSSVEGSPLAAVSVVVFPSNSLPKGITQSYPVYIMVHSSETGECPAGQCEYAPLLSCSLLRIT